MQSNKALENLRLSRKAFHSPWKPVQWVGIQDLQVAFLMAQKVEPDDWEWEHQSTWRQG